MSSTRRPERRSCSIPERRRLRRPSFFAGRRRGQQSGDPHQIVGQHGGADQELKALATLGTTAFHAPAAEEHRDASLNARAEVLALFEGCTLLVSFWPRNFLP